MWDNRGVAGFMGYKPVYIIAKCRDFFVYELCGEHGSPKNKWW